MVVVAGEWAADDLGTWRRAAAMASKSSPRPRERENAGLINRRRTGKVQRLGCRVAGRKPTRDRWRGDRLATQTVGIDEAERPNNEGYLGVKKKVRAKISSYLKLNNNKILVSQIFSGLVPLKLVIIGRNDIIHVGDTTSWMDSDTYH